MDIQVLQLQKRSFSGALMPVQKYGVAERDAAKLQMGEYRKFLLGFKTNF
jgi:hypothetical protein